MTGGRKNKVVRLKPPGPPPACRETPATDDLVLHATRHHHWQDEREKRQAQHRNLDEALSGVVPAASKGPVKPSTLLYGGRLGAVEQDWDNRWWNARMVEIGHFGVAGLLAALDTGLSCLRRDHDPYSALAQHIGRRVHQAIQMRYLRERRANRIALDNRVHTAAGSEQLSRLARKLKRGEYATLNYALAGGRVDIVDFTRREMWEIKPASLASEAVLQLWAYLDNHEVARVFGDLVQDGEPVAPMAPGDTLMLPLSVTLPIKLRLRGVPAPIVIYPYTNSRLPGLILYSVGVGRGRGKPSAAATLASARTQVNDLLVAAGRREQERVEAARKAASTYVLIAAAVAVILLARGRVRPLAVPPRFAAEVIRLGRGKALDTRSREVAREITKRAAGAVIITTAGGRFEVPPEAVGPLLDGGARAGAQLAPAPPQ